jgi:hypothetical protein
MPAERSDHIPAAAAPETRSYLLSCPLCRGPRRSEVDWESPLCEPQAVVLVIRVYCTPGCRWDGLQL